MQKTWPSTIGAEVEFTILDHTGKPVDLEKWLLDQTGKSSLQFPTGTLTVDLARWQGELQLSPVSFLYPEMLYKGALTFFREFRELIPSNWEIIFFGDMSKEFQMEPDELRQWMSRKPRYEVLISGLERMTPGASEQVLKIMLANATHIHLSNGALFDPFVNDEVIILMNHLNHWGLKHAHAWDCYRNVPPNRNGRFWSGFAPPERYPSPRIWQNALHYRKFVESLPRIITEQEGETVIDLASKGSIDDPLHRGTIWHGVRAAGANGKRWIEYRLASSLCPGDFASFLDEFCRSVRYCLETGTPELLSPEEWYRIF